MDIKHLSREELFEALQSLQHEHASLKLTYEKDLVEHQKIQEALTKGRNLYSYLINSIPDTSIHLLNKELRYIAIGGGEVEKNNFDKSQIEGKLLKEAFPNDIVEIFEPLYNKALKGDPSYFEMPYGAFLYSYQVLPVKDDHGEIFAVMSTSVNITDRSNAEKTLKQSEELNRLLFENSGEAILFTNPDGTIYSANPEACKLLGRSEAEIISIGRSGIMDATDPLFALALEERKRTGLFKGELRMVRGDGTVFPIEISSTIFKDSSGGGRTSMMFRDISDRKQVDEEIRHQNEELHTLNATKDKFFSIIAHDLRNPFSTLLGFTNLLVEELPNLTLDEIKPIALSMKISATNLYNLLQNLLEWSMLQRNLHAFNPRSFLLINLMVPILKSVRETADKKMIRISNDFLEDLRIVVDEQMFASLMQNLIYNAIKFTPRGGNIKLASIVTTDNSVKISVQDNGIGMNEEMIGKMFSLDADIKRKGTERESSTGLGMILCKEYVEHHGGKIWAESEENAGSTFYFTIPQPK